MIEFHILFKVILLTNVIIASSNAFHSPNYLPNRSVMVHLFEWKWNDIADECERFLGPNGYGGVQVSPVSENVIVENRPWWERYQPISYKIITRSGDKTEFQSMIDRCNQAGVRIYVDIVFNHMTSKKGSIIGTGGTTADVDKLDYPGIPYGPDDFHNPCEIQDYNDPNQVRNCKLVGLPDLHQGKPQTRSKIIQFMNELIELGVAGFRVDAAKHMWPSDLESIYNRLNNLSTKAFPVNSKPFIYQEVIDLGGEAIKKTEYTHMGAVTQFRFTQEIGRAFKGYNQLKWLQSWGPAWNFLPSKDAFVFVDNHDNQRSGNGDILTYKSRQEYIMAVAFMLSHPFGMPRIMSSFKFTAFDQGPPADINGTIISPSFNTTTEQCENGWVCEHRWPAIRNIIKFRNAVATAPVYSWWDNNRNQIAFCRGTRGFIAFNNEPYELKMKLFTCLPSGVYCDAITGGIDDGQCSGTKVVVDENGEANINVPSDIGVLAIHIGVKIQTNAKLRHGVQSLAHKHFNQLQYYRQESTFNQKLFYANFAYTFK